MVATDQFVEQKGLYNLIVWQKSMKFAVYICKVVLPNILIMRNGPWLVNYAVLSKVFLPISLKGMSVSIFKKESALHTLLEDLSKKL